jgi:hypothetical protein
MCEEEKRLAQVRRGDKANPVVKIIKKALLGIRLEVEQYKITGRELAYSYPPLKNSDAKSMDDFNKLSKDTHTNEKNYLEKAKANDFTLEGNQGDLTTNNAIKFVDNVWSRVDEKVQDLNDFLGQSVALHIARSKNYVMPPKGHFKCTNLEKAQNSKIENTEMMCAKIFPFVKLTAADKSAIFAIVDGKVSTEVVKKADYDEAKLIAKDSHNDPEGGSMKLIPGVLQFHILIELNENEFQVTEVHCDGDCIFPEI